MPSSENYSNGTNAYTYPMSSSPEPSSAPHCTDLHSYTRTMYQHTKRQMEAASQTARRRSHEMDNSSVRSYQTERSVGSVDSRAS